MGNTYAIVNGGVVVNIIDWDGTSEWNPKHGEAILIVGPCSIGWKYEKGVFVNPKEPPEPTQDELYEKELGAINDEYAYESSKLAKSFLNAGLFDGPTEDSKKQSIYSNLNEINSDYDHKIQSLDDKYGS